MKHNVIEQEDKQQEYDVSDDIIKWYQEIYEGEDGLGSYFELEKPCDGERKYFKMKENSMFNDYAKQMEISGDIIFNFSEKGLKGQSRYEILKKYIEDISDADLKKIYINKLDYCRDHHHSKENCSLMPKQGNLQDSKQGIGNDRGDTFIWALDNYYENGVEILFNLATYENKRILINYLETIRTTGKHQSVYNYCKLFYNIDDTRFINELIEFGCKTIDTEFRARRYIDLTLKFWELRRTYYECISNKERCLL